MPDKTIITKNFSKSAYRYNEYAAIQRFAAEYMIEEIPDDRFSHILEIGCGTGIYTSLLNTRFSHSNIRAIDISEKMIEVAKEKVGAKNVMFEVQDAEDMSFSEKYDLITSNSTFHWFKYIDKTILRLSGILNKEGWLIFSTFGPLTFIELAESLKKIAKSEDLFIASSYFQGKEELINLLKKIFAQVSVNEIVIKRRYHSLIDLLRQIKYTGTRGCANIGNYIWTPGLVDTLEGIYRKGNRGRIIATYQIFLCKVSR